MQSFSRSTMAALMIAFCLLFASQGIASAHTATSHTATTSALLLQLNHKGSAQMLSSYTGELERFVPQDLKCSVYRLNGWAGNLCVIVLLQCVGPVCVPYAVDLTMDQNGVNSLVSGGQTAVAAIVTLLTIKYPSLAPFSGPITVGLNWAVSQIGTFAKNACQGQGAGIYIGFPDGFYLHC